MRGNELIKLSSIIEESKDGEWGKSASQPNHEAMLVIRGTDFDKMKSGSIEGVPLRYIPNSIALRKSLNANDILIETAGGTEDKPTGRVAFVSEYFLNRYNNYKFTCASFSRFIRIDSSQANPAYIYWYLKFLYDARISYMFHTQHTGVARFQWTKFSNYPLLSLPNIETQKQIASILSAYDELIEVNNQRIKLLEETARELYKEWFVRMRFPGYKKAKFNKGIPLGWDEKKLGEMSEFINRGISPNYDDNGLFDTLNQRCIRNNRIDFDLTRKQSKKVPLNKILKTGDVLINSTGEGTLGRTAQVIEEVTNITADSHLTIARANKTFSKEYYGMVIQSLENYFELMAIGSTGQTELERKVIYNVVIKIPSIDVLEKFSEIISPMRKQLSVLLKQNTQLRQIRDRLLPRLISGKLQVKPLTDTGATKSIASKEKRTVAKKVLEDKNIKNNPYFQRRVLAAYIIDRLKDEPTFGHVKLMKLMYLCEHLAAIETASHYHRDAAGPYDNQMIRSIDSQLKKAQWFDCKRVNNKYQYTALQKKEEYKSWFIQYYSDKETGIESLLHLFGKEKTEKAEMVATLYEAWRDLKEKKQIISDKAIIHEVLNNWHESKQRISEDRWLKCLQWMKEKGWVQ